MRSIKLIAFCLVIFSIQSTIIGGKNMPFPSPAKAQSSTEETPYITIKAVGDGVTDDRSALQNAIDAASGDTVLLPAGTYRIGSNITVPEDVTLWFIGKLSIDAGVTVTINGKVEAGLHRIFSGSGSVSLATGTIQEVYPQWWGALGDDSNDDTTAIQAALDAVGQGITYFPEGTYKITSAVTVANSGAKLVGGAWKGTIIKVYGGGNGIVVNSGNHNVSIENFFLEADTDGSGYAVQATGSTRLILRRLHIGATDGTGDFERGIYLAGICYYARITECYFRHNQYGIYLDNGGGSFGPNGSIITYNEWGGACDYAIYIDNATEVRVIGNGMEGYTQRGIYCGDNNTIITENRFESSAIPSIYLKAGVTGTKVKNNYHSFTSTEPVEDDSASAFNDIEGYQQLFRMEGIAGTIAKTVGGSLVLSRDFTASNTTTDMKLEALTGDLQFEASTSGSKIDLQADVDVTSGNRLELHSPFLFTPAGGFGERAENRLYHSEDFSQTWVTTNVTVASDSVAGPNGRTTADTLTSTVASAYARQTLNDGNNIDGSVTPVEAWGSVWARAVSGTEEFRMRFRSSTGVNAITNVTLTTDWQRVTVSGTHTSNETVGFDIYPNYGNTGAIYVWGAQVVYGSDSGPVPYIKTTDAIVTIDSPALVGSHAIVGRLVQAIARISGAAATLSYSTTISADMDLGNVFTLTTTGGCTINANNGVAGQRATFVITDDATGGHVVTFGTNFKSSGTLTGTASKTATVDFVNDGTSWYEVSRTLGL